MQVHSSDRASAGASRWIPTVTMLLLSLISYIDRNTLALLAPTILKETRLSAEQYGFIISSFSVAYMIGNPVWGRVLDRFGLRIGLLAAVTLWTAASVGHAFAAGFLTFAVARAALGFGEGATFPGGLRAVVQTLRPAERSRGIAVAYSGGSLGAIVTPLIVTPIALWRGWRAGFWFTGLVGFLWIATWLVVSHRPQLRQVPEAQEDSSRPRPTLRDPRIWSFMGAYALGALPLGFVIYIASLYLSRNWNVTQAGLGRVLWIPPLGWEIGYFFWGWLSDRSLRSSTSPAAALRPLFAVAMLLSLPLALNPLLPSYGMALGGLFVSMFIASGFLILPIAYATRVYSTADSGLIAGLGAGAWSAAVAVTMPAFGHLFDLGHIQAAFALAAASPVAGCALWMWANRR